MPSVPANRPAGPPVSGPPVSRRVGRSLQFRLMVWNATVVIVTACVTLVALREGVRFTLIRELDQLLQEDAHEIAIALGANEHSSTLHEQLDRKDAGHAAHGWFAELVNRDGIVQYQSLHAPPSHVWDQPARTSLRTVGDWRLMTRVLPETGSTIRVGASLKLVRADIRRLDRFVALAACGVLVVAPLCGYWLALRATRPLASIIATMSRLRPSHLHERLEIRGTGDELDQLSIKFNRLLDRIATYLQDHRDFLANSAHELRTPLAAIRASIEVTLNGSRTNQEYRELLHEIIEESASLETLVNQLLLLSETETERLKLDKHHVQFDALIEKALDMFGGVAEYRDIELTCPALPTVVVEGNRYHLRQVVYNLLDNALKFTPPRGRVRVELRVDASRQSLVFTVSDTGPGILPGDLPHVFDRFFQGSRARPAGERRGTGLGLSICQAIVHAHEGKIEVHSKVGEGTRFVVTLPGCAASEDYQADGTSEGLSTSHASPAVDRGPIHSSAGEPLADPERPAGLSDFPREMQP